MSKQKEKTGALAPVSQNTKEHTKLDLVSMPKPISDSSARPVDDFQQLIEFMHIQGGLARLPEALVITGMKKSTFYNRQNPLHPSFDASFPARLQLSPGTVAWPRAALYEWCAKRPHVAA